MDVWTELVEGLMAYGAEEEWFEFKGNWFEPMVLGEHISALSNAAAMAGRKEAYFVWGVRDSDHEVVGTGFLWQRNVGGEPLEHWLARQVQPDIGFRFHEAAVRDHGDSLHGHCREGHALRRRDRQPVSGRLPRRGQPHERLSDLR